MWGLLEDVGERRMWALLLGVGVRVWRREKGGESSGFQVSGKEGVARTPPSLPGACPLAALSPHRDVGYRLGSNHPVGTDGFPS